MTRVLVVDDHRLLREALTELVASEPGFEVVASVGDVASVEPYRTSVDLVVLDLNLPGGGALELVRRLAEEGIARAVIVSMYESPEFVRSALAAGAGGYVFKGSSDRHLIDALHSVMAGQRYVDPALADSLVDMQIVTSPAKPVLSAREQAVLLELARGLTYKEIGEKLGIGARTVETYRRRVGEKLGLRTRADFLRYVVELKLIAED